MIEYRALKKLEAYQRYDLDGTDAQFIKSWNYALNIDEVDPDRCEIQRKYSQLCTELKFLYVAITRPKNRLFIYDENIQDRKPIEDIWTRIDAVQWITKQQVQEQLDQLKSTEEDNIIPQ